MFFLLEAKSISYQYWSFLKTYWTPLPHPVHQNWQARESKSSSCTSRAKFCQIEEQRRKKTTNRQLHRWRKLQVQLENPTRRGLTNYDLYCLRFEDRGKEEEEPGWVLVLVCCWTARGLARDPRGERPPESSGKGDFGRPHWTSAFCESRASERERFFWGVYGSMSCWGRRN